MAKQPPKGSSTERTGGTLKPIEVFRRDSEDGRHVVLAYYGPRTRPDGRPKGYLTFTIKKLSPEEREQIMELFAEMIVKDVVRLYRQSK